MLTFKNFKYSEVTVTIEREEIIFSWFEFLNSFDSKICYCRRPMQVLVSSPICFTTSIFTRPKPKPQSIQDPRTMFSEFTIRLKRWKVIRSSDTISRINWSFRRLQTIPSQQRSTIHDSFNRLPTVLRYFTQPTKFDHPFLPPSSIRRTKRHFDLK